MRVARRMRPGATVLARHGRSRSDRCRRRHSHAGTPRAGVPHRLCAARAAVRSVQPPWRLLLTAFFAVALFCIVLFCIVLLWTAAVLAGLFFAMSCGAPSRFLATR